MKSRITLVRHIVYKWSVGLPYFHYNLHHLDFHKSWEIWAQRAQCKHYTYCNAYKYSMNV